MSSRTTTPETYDKMISSLPYVIAAAPEDMVDMVVATMEEASRRRAHMDMLPLYCLLGSPHGHGADGNGKPIPCPRNR